MRTTSPLRSHYRMETQEIQHRPAMPNETQCSTMLCDAAHVVSVSNRRSIVFPLFISSISRSAFRASCISRATSTTCATSSVSPHSPPETRMAMIFCCTERAVLLPSGQSLLRSFFLGYGRTLRMLWHRQFNFDYRITGKYCRFSRRDSMCKMNSDPI